MELGGGGVALTLFVAIQSCDFMQHRTVLHKPKRKSKIWQVSHSIGYVTECEESHCSEYSNITFTTSLILC